MQISSTATNQKQKTLFGLMSQVLCLAQQLKQENIFLVGQTRSGKSTLFNWIINNRLLIGSGQRVDPVYSVVTTNALTSKTEFIQASNTSSVYAQVREGYKSVTLLPNIFHLSQSLGLVDLPGTRDQRSQIHVMMVSYIYNVFLKSSKRAKFVLVISNEGFNAPDSTKMVSLITTFIKLFKCNDMKDQQRQQLWKSVSLLVTSVPIEQGMAQQMKENYLKKLVRKLSFLKQLQTYQKIGQIFPYIEMMLNSIIQNKRLELFPKAKYGKVAQPSEVLRRFDNQGWNTCQLQSVSQFLKFPYAQQFLQLTPSQQQNLRNSIYTKVEDFKKFQYLFCDLINTFFKNPIHNTYQVYEYQEIHLNIQEFYLQNLIQDADSRERQRTNINQCTCQIPPNHSPTFILNNIIKINQISFEMDGLVEYAFSQNKQGKINFLKNLFVKCFDWIIQAFALTKQSKYVMQKIKDLLCERFKHFMNISEIQKDFESSFTQALKEYIQVGNQCIYSDYQIVGIFCRNANQEEELAQMMEIQHIQQFVQFLGEPQEKIQEKVQSLDIILKLQSKLYKLGAQKYSQQQKHKESVTYYLEALIHLVKLKVFYQIQLQHSVNQDSNFLYNVNKIDKDLYKILQDLSIEILATNQGQNFSILQRLYAQSNIFCYILQTYQKYSKKQMRNPKSQLLFLENYVKICEEQNDYKAAIQVYKKILSNKQLKSKRNQYKDYLERKKKFEQKVSHSVVQREKEQITIEKYLQFAQLTYSQILKPEKIVCKTEQIYAEMNQKLAKKLQALQQEHQFTVELPQNLTNYDIIVYSRYLVSKINNRKTIILLGNKAGKSTASYWLRNKKLVQYNHQIDIENRQTAKFDSIKHKVYEHTEVPNIHALNAEQLLVDAPHIYDKNLERMLIVSHFIKEVIANSSSSKFLLVVKQQDILMNHCIPLVQMLQYYVKIFDNFQENEGLEKSLALLVTFINPKNKNQVRKKLNQLHQLFRCEQNDYTIEQKFKLNKAENPCSRKQIFKLLDYIRRFVLIKELDIQQQYKKNVLRVHQIGLTQHCSLEENGEYKMIETNYWMFRQVKHIIGSACSSFDPFPLFKENIIQNLGAKITYKILLAYQILQLLKDMLFQLQILTKERSRLRLQVYENLIGSQLIKKDNWPIQDRQKMDKQAKAIKLFRYAELPMPGIQKEPLASHLRLFSTFKIPIILTESLQPYQFGTQFEQLKGCIKQIYSIYLEGVTPFSNNCQNLEITWMILWQILTELQIIQLQSNRRYSQSLSDKIRIKDKLYYFAHKIIQKQHIIARQFLKLIEEQLKLAKQDTRKIDLIYQVLNTIKESPVYSKIFYKQRQQDYSQVANSIKKVQQWFIKNSPNDKQAAAVLIEQSLNYINPNNTELFFDNGDKNKDKSLKLTLEENIKLLCQKLATFDPKSALKICDQLQNNQLKKKVFEIMQRKQLLNHHYFQLYYDCLIQNGDNSIAYKLIECEREKGKISKKQYLLKKKRAMQEKGKREMRKEVTLEELKKIIKDVKPDYFGQQSQQQLDS